MYPATMSSKLAMNSVRHTAAHVFRSSTPALRLRTAPPPLLRIRNTNIPAFNSRIINAIRCRHQSTDDKPLTDRPKEQTEQDLSDADAIAMRKAISPAYQLWFTCKQCLERSGHTVSKQAYHFGTCVIACPKCKSQHLISDHLKIFSDKSLTLEDIAKEHGQIMRKGRLGADGDIEFYKDDATEKVS